MPLSGPWPTGATKRKASKGSPTWAPLSGTNVDQVRAQFLLAKDYDSDSLKEDGPLVKPTLDAIKAILKDFDAEADDLSKIIKNDEYYIG